MFYRGAEIKELNQDEFMDNTIDGEEIQVIEVDFPDGVGLDEYKLQEIHNFARFISDSERVDITGGLTDRLTAAIKFTQQTFPPGVVLIMDETNIPASVEEVEYDPDWFDAHPGVLARVTTLRDGEVREDGKIIGFLDGREDKTIVGEHRRSEVEAEATANRYVTEREMVAFTDEIWLDDAITSLAIYRGTSGTSPYTLTASLSESPLYRTGISGVKEIETRKRVADLDDYRTQAELLYDEIPPLLQYDADNLFLVAVEDMNDVSSRNDRIQPDNFEFVYNGRGFDESYQRNSHLLGV